MILRSEWADVGSDISGIFYSAEETVSNVKENFDIRRFHSAEGKTVTINEQTEKCLVQTSSNPFTKYDDLRKVHCPIHMQIHRGDYVQYEDDYWIIKDNVIDVDGAYISIRMNRCSYVLKWQNESGEIIERPIFSLDASAYNSGQWDDGKVVIGNDQIMLWIPMDLETIKIKRGKKFFISNDKFDPVAYDLTRPDSTTHVFKEHGCLIWLCTETQHTISDIEIETGVCDYILPDQPNIFDNISYQIIGDSELMVLSENIYVGKMQDENQNEIFRDFEWGIESKCIGLSHTQNSQDISLSTSEYDDIGVEIMLSIIIDSEVKASKTIQVSSFL